MLWQLSRSLSLAHASTHRAGANTSLFPKLSPRLGHSSPRHGVLMPLHAEPPPASGHCRTTRKASPTKNTAFQERLMALSLFALEMRRQREDMVTSFPRWLEAERQAAHADGSKGGCRWERRCFLAQQAGIYCAHPFPEKGLLNKTCWAGNVRVLFVWVSLPCTQVSSSVWAATHLRTAPVRCIFLPGK